MPAPLVHALSPLTKSMQYITKDKIKSLAIITKDKIRPHQPPENIDILSMVLDIVPISEMTLRVRSLRPFLIKYTQGTEYLPLQRLNSPSRRRRMNPKMKGSLKKHTKGFWNRRGQTSEALATRRTRRTP